MTSASTSDCGHQLNTVIGRELGYTWVRSAKLHKKSIDEGSPLEKTSLLPAYVKLLQECGGGAGLITQMMLKLMQCLQENDSCLPKHTKGRKKRKDAGKARGVYKKRKVTQSFINDNNKLQEKEDEEMEVEEQEKQGE
jgi:hypothetical protein